MSSDQNVLFMALVSANWLYWIDIETKISGKISITYVQHNGVSYNEYFENTGNDGKVVPHSRLNKRRGNVNEEM